MSPAEFAWRVREQALRRAWARRQVLPGQVLSGPVPGLLADARRFTAVLPADGAALAVAPSARDALVACADRILKGEWEMLGVVRTDMSQPDWFYDPVTGRRSDPALYAFRINQRSEEQVGNVKQVWEVNRLQHLTLLAAAWYVTGSDAYASLVDAQLRSWWSQNPFLSGVNWTSGIELGVRLLNFAWIRRLLDSWPGVHDLFEDNELFLRQLRWHQEYLAAFESRGSSANNHVIAEAAGLLVASCAFPWFLESERWRESSLLLLSSSLRSNTFPSGINRELASDYHGFVFELGVFAAIEASVAGFPVRDETWQLLCSMADCMAALADLTGRPPRQGDSDEGRVVVLDPPEHNRWPALLSVADALFGSLDWWPRGTPDLGGILAGVLAGASAPGDPTSGDRLVRPAARPSRFADAGITVLRTEPGAEPEIWCRCDGGPHGFLSIAAHAHADALSVEVRHGGVDILADPGTYCYHGEPEWRSYFRSTVAHNTVEVGGVNQSADGGAFMWLRHARTREIDVSDVKWTAEHDGYAVLDPPATHRRTVRLDESARVVEITDTIDGTGHEVRVAFHLGPDVSAELSGSVATLTWPTPAATVSAATVSAAAGAGTATLSLPADLEWRRFRGETAPIHGWYSPGLGQRVPAVTLLGRGRGAPGRTLISRLQFPGTASPRTCPDSGGAGGSTTEAK
jgi:hypothetical protein